MDNGIENQLQNATSCEMAQREREREGQSKRMRPERIIGVY